MNRTLFMGGLALGVAFASQAQAVTLTRVQRVEMQAIQSEYAPKLQTKNLKQILLAKKVNESALRTYLIAQKQEFRRQIGMLKEMRLVLTPSQRQELVRDVTQGRYEGWMTQDQRAVLESLDQRGLKNATLALLKSGDSKPLDASVGSIKVEPLVRFASLLEYKQRQAFVRSLNI